MSLLGWAGSEAWPSRHTWDQAYIISAQIHSGIVVNGDRPAMISGIRGDLLNRKHSVRTAPTAAKEIDAQTPTGALNETAAQVRTADRRGIMIAVTEIAVTEIAGADDFRRNRLRHPLLWMPFF